MAISNTTLRKRHAGSGTSYAIPFIFYDTDELRIIRTTAAGAETTLAETTDYSISGGSGSTGTCTTVTSYSDGLITILHSQDFTQGTDYAETSNFSVETLEQDIDKLTLLAHNLKERIDRALRVIPSTDMTAFDGKVTPAAGKLIGFNAAGDGIITYDDADQGDADLSDLFNGGYSKSIYPNDIFFAAGVKILEGSGSPEGAVEASVGSIYLRTDGGADTSVYYKESGSGNTGWVTRGTLNAPAITSFANAAHDHSNAAGGGALSAGIMQAQHTQSGAVATGSTTIPLDDTIPQNTEGDELYTLAITPTSATNKLVIEAVINAAASAAASNVIIALFQDSTANALAVSSSYGDAADIQNSITLRYEMVAGTTSETTFKIRIGCNSGNWTVNGAAGVRQFGGVCMSSLRITEYIV